jgi:regulator of protease activity HflC (stomatin/prohibitin superfamily)
MKRKAIKITLGIVVLIVIIILASSIYVVQENEYACIVRFSKIVIRKIRRGFI